MIATFMAYAVLISSASALAAWALERSRHPARRPVRFVWASAIVLAISLPVVGVLRASGPVAHPSDVGPTLAPRLDAARSSFDITQALARVDRPLAILWAGGSLLLLALLVRGQTRLVGAARRAPTQTIAGVPVHRTTTIGPAVVGVFPSLIVMPDWVDRLDEHWQHLVLQHEFEHLRSGDARLLYAATTAVVLMPWNPVVWWLVGRLRDAVEFDCDLRVLATGVDARAYGALLVEVAQRGLEDRLPAVAFSNPSSLLSRRIDTMFDSRRPSRARAIGLTAASVALVAIACETPSPVGLPDEGSKSSAAAAEFDATGLHTVAPDTLFGSALRFSASPQWSPTGDRLAFTNQASRSLGELRLIEERVSSFGFIVKSENSLHEPDAQAWRRDVTSTTDMEFGPAIEAVESPSSPRAQFERRARVDAELAAMKKAGLVRLTEQSGAAGVLTARHGRASFSPRSEFREQVTTQIDGTLVPNWRLRELDPADVESIEIVKGRSAADTSLVFVRTKSHGNRR